MGFRLSGLVGLALTWAVTSTAQAQSYNTDKIGNLMQHARRDMTLVCAHRGLHGTAVGTNSHQDWLRNIPENSVAAIEAAATQGIECSEIDIRFDRQGNVAVIHDTNLGRTTDAYRHVDGATEYDPYSRRGYNPGIEQFTGETWRLALRHPNLSGYSDSRFTRLHDILSAGWGCMLLRGAASTSRLSTPPRRLGISSRAIRTPGVRRPNAGSISRCR